jgi:hypothetical protein
MDSLPDDLWELIHDIARELRLVAVCRRTYRLLRGRHVIYRPGTTTVFDDDHGCTDINLRTLDFRCPHSCRDRRTEMRMLAARLTAPPHRCAELRELRLDLWCGNVGSMGDDGVRWLGAFIRDHMPALESLNLILFHNEIRGDVDSLVPFGRRLRHLDLDLSRNFVEGPSIQTLLRGLSDVRTLERVTPRPDRNQNKHKKN